MIFHYLGHSDRFRDRQMFQVKPMIICQGGFGEISEKRELLLLGAMCRGDRSLEKQS